MIRSAIVFLLALTVAAPLAAAPFEEGKDYRRFEQPHRTDVAEGNVEVREFFSYGCPHCFDFRPLLDAYLERSDKAELVRVPVSFGRQQWATLGKGYYAAKMLGELETMHETIFNAVHVRNQRPGSVDAVVALFESQGIDPEEARKTLESFAVDMKMRRADKLVQEYGIRSTPSVAVAGKYLVSPRSAGSQKRMIDVIDYLVSRESGGR